MIQELKCEPVRVRVGVFVCAAICCFFTDAFDVVKNVESLRHHGRF